MNKTPLTKEEKLANIQAIEDFEDPERSKIGKGNKFTAKKYVDIVRSEKD